MMISSPIARVGLAALSLSMPFPLTQCGLVPGKKGTHPVPISQTRSAFSGSGETQRGQASYYSQRTNGTRTASGIPLNDSIPTAAHRSLPFGTFVRVTNLRNGRSEIVKITDRGPFIRGRIIDLSLSAAKRIEMINSGVVPVEIEVLNPPNAM